ncbi:MAG: hypothetical protein ACP5N3_05840 [Candidatus Nanoarchaeia archaeon]
MENETKKDYMKPADILLETLGAVMKYGGLMIGFYSMCQDEKDFYLATIGGCAYISGAVLNAGSRNHASERQFNNLEKTLKEEIAKKVSE